MKGLYVSMLCILFLAMLLLPMFALDSPGGTQPGGIGNSVLTEYPDSFVVYFPETDTTQKLTTDAYLYGVLAAEMSAGYHEEALKAQAVASYTYACYKRAARRAAGERYDVVANTTDQAYLTPEAAAAKWGDATATNKAKLEAAIAAVKGYVIKKDGAVILAAFHAISSGKTESAEKVWGGSYPYLTPVESIGDLLATDYLSERRCTAEEFRGIAADLGCTLAGEAASWPREPERSASGTVLQYTLGDKQLTGQQMREAFGLRSANFDLSYTDGNFVFTVRGYGHGVGMSQYGANYMAQQGSTFLEILSWYYPTCQLEKP